MQTRFQPQRNSAEEFLTLEKAPTYFHGPSMIYRLVPFDYQVHRYTLLGTRVQRLNEQTTLILLQTMREVLLSKLTGLPVHIFNRCMLPKTGTLWN